MPEAEIIPFDIKKRQKEFRKLAPAAPIMQLTYLDVVCGAAVIGFCWFLLLKK